MRYIYIHGFNSGPESRSGRLLRELLGTEVFCPRNDYSQPFNQVLQNLEKQILTETGCEKLCLMGTSLGGFYALQLRLPHTLRVAAWNPVIYPATQLAKFVGQNTRFTDGTKWMFERTAQLSYARALDARIWDNNCQNDCRAAVDSAQPLRKVFLGSHDEVLDYELGMIYWDGYAELQIIDSGHSIADFGHAADFLKDGQ